MNKVWIKTFLLLLSGIQLLNAQGYRNFKQTGIASYFTEKYDGRKTVSGEIFRNDYYVGSHKTLPFSTMVRVTNLENQQSVVVRIIDRGPYAHGRIIDVSEAAAEKIDLISTGSAKITLEVVGENGRLYEDIDREKQEKEDEKNLTKANTSEDAKEDAVFKTGKTYTQWGTAKTPKGYGLQVGVFGSVENAKKTCQELTQKGIQAVYYIYIQVGWNNTEKVPVYRILVGEFPENQGEAISKAQKRLKEAGYESLIKSHL